MGERRRSPPVRTAQGFPPATPTELEPASGANDGMRPELEIRRSVILEEIRVSALDPLASGSRTKESLHAAPERVLPRAVDLSQGALVCEYEIERKVGEGGMGAVYAARHPILGKRVAIKIIGEEISNDANAIARFRREARAVAQLKSPHIVDVFGFGEQSDGRAYFVMEYLVGESLRERVVRGRVPLDEALDLIDQTARGLEAAHAAGIVHRDLKPENVFVERAGSSPRLVKLLDFGIVKIADADMDVAQTQAGALIGTPLYVAPEQIRMASAVDHRADIYSLGCLAFEVILGRVPFPRATVVEVVAAHLECAPPQPRSLMAELPAALDALLLAMLAKDPAKRPTLGHVQETIEKVRSSAFARPSPSVPPPPTAPEAPRLAAPLAILQGDVSAGPRPIPQHPNLRPGSRPPRSIALMLAAMVVAIAVVASPASRPPAVHRWETVAPIVVPLDAGPVAAAPIAAIAPRPDATRETVVHAGRRAGSPGQPAGQRPAPMPGADVGRRSATRVQAGSNASTEPASEGELAISAKPPCEIAIDGRPTGHRTPLASLHLSAGAHRVSLVNLEYRINESMTVVVHPGEVARLIEDYSNRAHVVDPNGTIDPFGGAGP